MIALSQPVIEKLRQLTSGETVPSSAFKGPIVEEMLWEGAIVALVHGSKKVWRTATLTSVAEFLERRYEIRDLDAYAAAQRGEMPVRSAQVRALGNSKAAPARSMKGFLVNSYQPVYATLRGRDFVVAPPNGSFAYIYDFWTFTIPSFVTVVGVENAENFRKAWRHRDLFRKLEPVLFVCRYPASGDLLRWLQGISNRYVHFGDLDLAGVSIYLSEYYAKLGSRASFFIPADARERLAQGSRERYDTQLARYGKLGRTESPADPRVQPLLDLIHAMRRGYDQEGFVAISE